MGASIEFFAAAEDDSAFREFARSIGLHVVNMLFDRRGESFEDPRSAPACFLALVEPDLLHPFGPRRLISDATDPVIEFSRSVHEPPDLIAGRLYWSDDVEDFARQTKPHFRKLVTWIRRNWSRRPDGYYAGPRATDLLAQGLAKPHYMKPGITVRSVEV